MGNVSIGFSTFAAIGHCLSERASMLEYRSYYMITLFQYQCPNFFIIIKILYGRVYGAITTAGCADDMCKEPSDPTPRSSVLDRKLILS
jgi:hypothetical protein